MELDQGVLPGGTAAHIPAPQPNTPDQLAVAAGVAAWAGMSGGGALGHAGTEEAGGGADDGDNCAMEVDGLGTARQVCGHLPHFRAALTQQLHSG